MFDVSNVLFIVKILHEVEEVPSIVCTEIQYTLFEWFAKKRRGKS